MPNETADPATLADADFLTLVESAEIAPQTFNHKAHVRAAFLLLKDADDFAPALERMSTALRRIATKAGVPEKYHETITVAFTALVHVRMAAAGMDMGWTEFAERNADLFETDPLAALYSPDLLASPLARRVFVLPDMAAQASA